MTLNKTMTYSKFDSQPVKARHRYVKSFSLGINDIFFQSSRAPWLLADFIVVFLTFHFGIYFSPYGHSIIATTPLLTTTFVYSSTFVLAGLGLGFYDRRQRRRRINSLLKILVIAVLAVVVSLFIAYFAFYDLLGRFTLIYGIGFSTLAIAAERMLVSMFILKNPYRFSIASNTPLSRQLRSMFNEDAAAKLGCIHIPLEEVANFETSDQTSDQVVDWLLYNKIGDLIISQNQLNSPRFVEFVIKALQARIKIVTETQFFTNLLERFPIEHMSKDVLLTQGIAQRRIITALVKRVFDFIIASAVLIVISPVLLLIAIAIKLDSKGPVIFKQHRQGRYFKPFQMYKFRTMKQENSDAEGKDKFYSAGDLRVTRVGRFLRYWHLDEVPQLVNILAGDMTIVGPRPEALHFSNLMKKEIAVYELRYLMRPGLTGLAQIYQGYAGNDVQDVLRKLSYDLYYLCKNSFAFDLEIIIRTVFYFFKKRSH